MNNNECSPAVPFVPSTCPVTPLNPDVPENLVYDLSLDPDLSILTYNDAPSIGQIADGLCDDTEDLPVGSLKEIINGSEDKDNLKRMAKEKRLTSYDRGYKNGNVVYEGEIAKVKGPIVKVLDGVNHVDFEPEIIMENSEEDTKIAKLIAKNFGAANYDSIISPEINLPIDQGQVVSLAGLIPDLQSEKMFCSPEDIDNSRKFCEQNKDKMSDQMNVVAMYSVKDAKPFYYISSAEARMAVNYINMCRKLKTDIYEDNKRTINDFVWNIDSIIKKIEDQNPKDIPETVVLGENLVWTDISETEDIGDFLVANTNTQSPQESIKGAYRKVYIPMEHNRTNVIFRKYRVEVEKRTIKALTYLIDFHIVENSSLEYSHYIVCGKNTLRMMLSDDSRVGSIYYGDKTITIPNSVERNVFKIMANRENRYGKTPVFINEKIDYDSMVVVSRNFVSDGSTVIVAEYYLDKKQRTVKGSTESV